VAQLFSLGHLTYIATTTNIERTKTMSIWKTLFGGSKPQTPESRPSPQPTSPPRTDPTPKPQPAPTQVTFQREEHNAHPAASHIQITKKIYSAQSKEAAVAFLRAQNVSEQFLYIEVDTPSGRFGIDNGGRIYDSKGDFIAVDTSSLLTDNGDGTVTDNKARLVWQKADDDQRRNWSDAVKYAKSLSLAGRSDWRLPSDKELVSLWNNAGSSDEARKTYFPSMKPKGHWSSTTNPRGSDEAYVIVFDRGGVFSDMKTEDYYVRCVRSVA